MQSDLDRFRATLSHRRPERILFRADFTPDLHRRLVARAGTEDLDRHYGVHDRGHIAIRRPAELPRPDYAPYWRNEKLPDGTTINDYGVAMVPSGYYHFWGYVSPLRNARAIADLENYPIDDVRKWDFSGLKAHADARHAGGKIAGASIGHMYETAWQIRGYEQFLMDMVENPSWAECLLERLMDQNMAKAEAYARAGADMIATGDDVANQENLMFAPDAWRGLMLKRWKKVWGRIKEINPGCKIWYHSDGNISAIIGDLIEAGVDILNPLQPECLDLDAIHKRYGRQLVFDGCIGTQSTMPFGKPADVRARVKEVIEKYGREGGLIVSPTHALEPDVPLENIDMFFAACNEYGK